MGVLKDAGPEEDDEEAGAFEAAGGEGESPDTTIF